MTQRERPFKAGDFLQLVRWGRQEHFMLLLTDANPIADSWSGIRLDTLSEYHFEPGTLSGYYSPDTERDYYDSYRILSEDEALAEATKHGTFLYITKRLQIIRGCS